MDTSGRDQKAMQPLPGAQDQQEAPPPPVQVEGGAQTLPVTEQPVEPSATAPAAAEAMAQGKPSGAKEQEPVSPVGASERVPIVEMREPKELPEEVEGWLERVEREDVEQPRAVVHKGKTIVSPSAPQDVSVTLPLTEEEVKQGLHHKLVESVRWMAEWCARIVKKYHGRIAYKIRGE
jgi:galactose-1-phosphate uridylyltransferase